MYLLFFIALVFTLFFNTKIPKSLGYEGIIHTLSTVPMVIYFVIRFITQKIQLNKDAVFVIFLAVIILIFKWAIGQNYMSDIILLLIFPMLTSMCFDNLSGKELDLLRYFTIIFFITECCLAIVEWRLSHNFFTYQLLTNYTDNWVDVGFFRSTSLLGHPLANAQVVAVFMTFFAVADFKKKIIQIIFLYLLGYVALFCFNARGAILVVTVFVTPYFIWKINKIAPKKIKLIINVGVICIFLGMFYIIAGTSMGNRLTGKELIDDSGQTRFEVINFYKHYKTNDDFLWGHPDNYVYMMGKLGAAGVENGVITLILEYGIIFTIPLLILLFRFQYRKLSMYSKSDKWLLLLVFYLIGNMNPNLAEPIQWLMWIFVYYVFRPELSTPQTVNAID